MLEPNLDNPMPVAGQDRPSAADWARLAAFVRTLGHVAGPNLSATAAGLAWRTLHEEGEVIAAKITDIDSSGPPALYTWTEQDWDATNKTWTEKSGGRSDQTTGVDAMEWADQAVIPPLFVPLRRCVINGVELYFFNAPAVNDQTPPPEAGAIPFGDEGNRVPAAGWVLHGVAGVWTEAYTDAQGQSYVVHVGPDSNSATKQFDPALHAVNFAAGAYTFAVQHGANGLIYLQREIDTRWRIDQRGHWGPSGYGNQHANQVTVRLPDLADNETPGDQALLVYRAGDQRWHALGGASPGAALWARPADQAVSWGGGSVANALNLHYTQPHPNAVIVGQWDMLDPGANDGVALTVLTGWAWDAVNSLVRMFTRDLGIDATGRIINVYGESQWTLPLNLNPGAGNAPNAAQGTASSALQPAALPDTGAGAAPSNSLYYSTTLNRLAYKDADGAVHALY